MIAIVIFALTFLAVGIWIFWGIYLPDIINNIKNKKAMKTSGKTDLEKILQAMQELEIPIPEKNSDDLKHLENCLYNVKKYAWTKIEEHIKNHKLKYKKLTHEVFIIYDSEKVIFPNENILLFAYYIYIKTTDNVMIFHRNTDESLKENITTDKLISILNNLDDDSFLNVDGVKWDELTWYLADVPDSAERLGSIAASATLGGLAFGAIGALGAGMSASKKEQEDDKACRIMFGFKGKSKWQIARDLNSRAFKEAFEFFNTTCPQIRSNNIMKKYN